MRRSRRIPAQIEAEQMEISQASAAPRRRLRAVLTDDVERPGVVHVLWPASRHLSPKIRALVDFLSECVLPTRIEWRGFTQYFYFLSRELQKENSSKHW
ncbi:hypothetical protein F4827_004168 [Paraburkholderia bannensis]|uniref:LysR substrate-binding domain-containing protein n=1 Tax=Paraburkholderia bannensis TaxID=765414 RepID=A0A7W9WU62_9BURK|nr:MULTISPECIES: hypothetical protein [Paraburkholderia]MBB3259293.1 hypothetical protein [Paraburkholderia sp. WP4_3_2]MBB6104309.1 hypothetical protein [Paraburkholderia bannensis]